MTNLNAPEINGPTIKGLTRHMLTYTLPGGRESEASVTLFEHLVSKRKHWRISKLWVAPHLRQRGLATTILSAITAQADIEGVYCDLTAEPDRNTLTLTALKRFYGKHGFVQVPRAICGYEQYMERAPRST